MIVNEKKTKQQESKIISKVKSFFHSIFFCCPTFLEPKRYYLDLGPIPYNDSDSTYKKTLVLDVDQTLICSRLENVKKYDFKIEYKYRGISFIHRVIKRPGLDEFLKYAKDNFDVVMFTASIKDHSDPVIDMIAPWVPKTHRFYRNDCLYINSYFIKDLDRLNRPLESIIIVDDSQASFSYHNSNGILIPSFEGDKTDNVLLGYVLPILMKAKQADDVREIIKKYR